MATYISVWSDSLCFRASPSALPPSSLIWLLRRLQRATNQSTSDDLMSRHFYQPEWETKMCFNCNWEVVEKRLTRAPGEICCASRLHLDLWPLHLRFGLLEDCKEQRSEPRAKILVSHHFLLIGPVAKMHCN